MAFRLPDYSDRPLLKNPYVLWGLGLLGTSVFLNWRSNRQVHIEDTTYTPPADEPATPGGYAPVGMATTSFSAAQSAAFRDALPERAKKYADFFVRAGASKGVSPLLLAGIMSTETGYGSACKDAKCLGFLVKDGHGDYGLMQINSKAHPEFFKRVVNGRPAYEDPGASIEYGATVLKQGIDYIRQKHGLSGNDLLFAGVASYNAGAGAVSRALSKGNSADSVTYNKRYAKTSFDHAESLLNKMNMVVG